MININNLPEQIDPVVARKYKEKQIQKEKYIFFALCSDEDRALITGERKMAKSLKIPGNSAEMLLDL